MTYLQSLDYLEALAAGGVKAGLEHTRHLARRLGDPQDAYPCLLVGGTNGKGSTSSFLASILRAAGLKVGLYTSPHLVEVRERIQVGEAMISEGDFAGALSEIRRGAEGAVSAGELGDPPTYFEALTLAAFHHFRSERVDAAVLEVGLGGRLDCTNIVNPIISVVTNIAQDHEDYLGVGLENIAREKAGIFRPGIVALTSAREGIALDTLRASAAERGTPLHDSRQCAVEERGETWRMVSGRRALDLPRPALRGRHQLENAALAVRAGWSLRDMGWAVSDGAIVRGISGARWPGRLELMSRGPDVYLDGAHNPEGCQALASFVRELPQERRALVVTAMRDKPVSAMFAPLMPLFHAVWATGVPMPRCIEPEDLATALGSGVRVARSPLEALREAVEWAGPEGAVVVAGSLYLVGFVKSLQSGELSPSWGSGL